MSEWPKDSFAWRRLKALGYDRIAATVAERQPLSEMDEVRVMNAPLPVLAKLIELHRLDTQRERKPCKLSPVAYFPLAAALEDAGPELAAERCIESLLTATTGTGRSPSGLGIVTDRWTGSFRFEELAEAIALTSQRLMLESLDQPFFTGPSTGELKQILRSRSDTQSPNLDRLPEVLSLLKRAGIRGVEGGTDIAVHEVAAQAGFVITFTQDLTRGRLAHAVVTATTEAGRPAGEATVGLVHAPHQVGEQFRATLREVTTRLCDRCSALTWAPAASAPLDISSAPESPLGAELMTAIAVARLLLPRGATVRAPLSLMGVNAAHSALWFGANDIGFAAIDAATAEQLALPLYEDIAATIELTTPVAPSVRELGHSEARTSTEEAFRKAVEL